MKRHSRQRHKQRGFNIFDPFSGRGRGGMFDVSPPKSRGSSMFDMPKGGGMMGGLFGGAMPGSGLMDPSTPQGPRRVRRKRPRVFYKHPKPKYYPRERPHQEYREPEEHHEKKGVDWKGLASKVVSGTRRAGMAAKARVESVNQNTKNYNALRSKYASGGWKALSDSEKKSITEGAAKRGESI